MGAYYYIGLDIHKRTISYCIKAIDGSLIGQGKIEADRKSLDEWAKGLPTCRGPDRKTIFSVRSCLTDS